MTRTVRYAVDIRDPEEGWRRVVNGFGESPEPMTKDNAVDLMEDIGSSFSIPIRNMRVVPIRASRRALAHMRKVG